MKIDDTKEPSWKSDDSDLELENDILKNQLGISNSDLHKTEHTTPELENQFLRNMKAFHEMDDGPKQTVRDLFVEIQEFPPLDTLDPQELARILDIVDDTLNKHQLSLDLNPKLSDERIYAYFLTEILDEEIPLFMAEGIVTHFDGCGGNCPECFQADVCENFIDFDDEDAGSDLT